jgi:hypothetical protein
MRALVVAVLVVMIAHAAQARVLEVGPARTLKLPSQAAATARNGDVVRIDAGEYRDCAAWRADGLVIEGVGGTARLDGAACGGQAIWLIRGNRATVRRVAFANARNAIGNAAGLKFMGRDLSIEECDFRANENGVLVNGVADSNIRIANSRFIGNGRCLRDCAHGLYVGKVRRLIVTHSAFVAQSVGHHIKSRALFSEIAHNWIADGESGTASYAVDLPNAGTAFILNNRIEKGQRADNPLVAVAIGAEGATNPGNGVYVSGNIFKNDNPRLETFVRNFAPEVRVELGENRFLGIPAPPLRVAPLEKKD